MDKKGIKGILLMGGSGERFASDLPKQFHRLFGKKVYLHTLEALIKANLFEEILLVTTRDWIEEVKEEIRNYPSSKITVVEGGKSRQESSFKGLLACGPGTRVVVIHDAVRPFISQEILLQNVEGALSFEAVDTCIPSADTLVFAPEKDKIQSIPPREQFLRGQTPQSFSYPVILKAHLHAQTQEIHNSSDDCALVLALGHSIHIVQGSEANIKITSPLDLILAEQISRLNIHSISLNPLETSLKNKRFAVTGGTGGIGSAVAELLRQEGAEPIILSKSSLDFPIDLTHFAATENAFQKIHAQHGPLDGLINCIGLLKLKDFYSLTQEEIDLLIQTNLMSVVYSCRAAQLKEGAHIINLASSSYTRGRKNYALYSGAKAAIVNFTQGLAEETPQFRINTIVPQRTETPMRKANFPDEHPSTLLSPHDVAKEIVLLLKQSTITGAVIEVRKT